MVINELAQSPRQHLRQRRVPLSLLVVVADGWDKRWTKSTWKQSDGSAGEFKWTAGKWYGDEKKDKGIQTNPDSKYFAIYSELKKPYTNEKKELVLQVSCICSCFGSCRRRMR
jgi:hypothetical protein